MLLIGAIMLAGSFSGCNIARGVRDYVAYNTPTEDFVSGWRDRVWANRAYNARRDFYDAPAYESEFKAGFAAGYRDIAQGGDGCTPSLPPRKYWSWRYQSAEGQAKVAAWFSGFPHGARAAEEDGVGDYYQIQVASWLDENDLNRDCPDCGPDEGQVPWNPGSSTYEDITPQYVEPLQPTPANQEAPGSNGLPDSPNVVPPPVDSGQPDGAGAIPNVQLNQAEWRQPTDQQFAAPNQPLNRRNDQPGQSIYGIPAGAPIRPVTYERNTTLSPSGNSSSRRNEPLMSDPSSLPSQDERNSSSHLMPNDHRLQQPQLRWPTERWQNDYSIPTSSAVSQWSMESTLYR